MSARFIDHGQRCTVGTHRSGPRPVTTTTLRQALRDLHGVIFGLARLGDKCVAVPPIREKTR